MALREATEPSTSTSAPSSTDADLVAKIRAGDEAAFRALVSQMHPRLIRLARAFVPTDALAEEVAQETWLAVVRGLDGFEGRSSLRTWIYRIVTLRARTRGAREPRDAPLDELLDDDARPAVDPARFTRAGIWRDPPDAWHGRGAEALALDRELMEQLRLALEALPAGPRAVVTLRDVEGLDSDEVCNVLGITETNQRVLLHRGRARLRSALESYLKDR